MRAYILQVKRRKIFVSVMKWQSPNFIKAKCSDPNTIVQSFYFWNAFIVLIIVNQFLGGLSCYHTIRGPIAPSSGQALNCSGKLPLLEIQLFLTTQVSF